MSESRRDLLSTLQRLADEKRSGKLKLSGESWAATITLSKGVVSSVGFEPVERWRLGDVLRYVRILSPQRYRRANRVARKRGDQVAEAMILRKGWVAVPVYRRFQERICVQRIFVLASRVGYRAVFSAREVGGEAALTDVAVPVAFISSVLAERSRESVMDATPLPRADACFRKSGAAISLILGGQGDDLPEGAPLLGVTPSDRRVFFFCNGDVPFQDLSLVLGASPHQLAQSIRNLAKLNAVYPSVGASRWAAWIKGLKWASRPVLAFVGGLAMVALLLGVGGATLTALEEHEQGDWAYEKNRYFVAGQGDVRRILSDALFASYLNNSSYPETLGSLVDNGHISREWHQRQAMSRGVEYERDADQRGCWFSLGDDVIRFRAGRLLQSEQVRKKPKKD